MKRTPLARKTPLRAAAKIANAIVREPARIDVEAARIALGNQQRSAEAPRREHTPVPSPVRPATGTGDGSFSSVVRQTIMLRDGYRCQRCGRACDEGTGWPGYSLQHRAARKMGGTSDPIIAKAANGILLCGSGTTGCHGEVEANPDQAEAEGFAVPSWALPSSVPVYTFNGWRYLTDDGESVHTLTPPGGDALAVAVRRNTTH